MANNFQATEGSGKQVLADEINHADLGTGVAQMVKLLDGTTDSSLPIAAGPGAAANALRAVLASNDPAVLLLVQLVSTLDNALRALANPLWVDPATGRMRAVLDANGGAQTLATVTTVGTVTNQSQLGGRAADSTVFDIMTSCWGDTVRRCVT